MRRFALLACVLAVASLPAAPTSATADVAAPCEVLVDVPAQGPSCPIEGGWLVRLGDGAFVETHGPDPAEPFVGPDAPPARDFPVLLGPYAAPKPPTCAASGDYHMRVIYATPIDLPNRYLTIAPVVRTMVYMANGHLFAQAAQFGSTVNYKVFCSTGVMTIDEVVLPTPSNADSFATIVRDLQAEGYSSTRAKYWIYYDDHVAGAGGQGSINSDDTPGVGNANNVGPDYAITYGYLSVGIMMHENGHNLGAVQHSAPRASGGFHCNDGKDVMCYADGGSTSAYNPNVCLGVDDAAEPFDCGYNDYFHPRPPAGSYLATRWNLGSTANRFLSFTAP